MIPRICAALIALFLVASVVLAADKPVSDDTIYDAAIFKLASDVDVRGGGLKVEVKQGVVTLAGTVDSQLAKDKATRIVKKIKGVKNVVNNIVVKNHA